MDKNEVNRIVRLSHNIFLHLKK